MRILEDVDNIKNELISFGYKEVSVFRNRSNLVMLE